MTTTQIATRAEAVAHHLRRAIQAGEYISGERLVELTLAQQYNVSQNTARDALRILEGEGWVVKHARRGAFVRSYTADEAEELYTLWATLEGLAVRWAVEALTKADIGRLRQLLSQAQIQLQRGDVRGSTETIFAFHEAIWRIPERAQTLSLLNRLHNQVRLLETLRQMRAPRNLPQQETEIAACERVLAAMEAGDASAAQQAVHNLIMADCASLLPLLAVSV
jgi:DNA-binding GntR family transcriptional regulator